jgi:hypothetical protein
MSVVKSLFRRLMDSGVILSFEADGRLSIDAPVGLLTEGVVAEMREHRDDLVALVEQWGERAAIREYYGGLAREDAERFALADVLGDPPSPEYLPDEPGWLCPWCRRGDRLIEADEGLRCGRCNRHAFVREGGSIVRADYVGVDMKKL